MMKEQTPVEVFNCELERLVRGGVVIREDLTPEDQRALKVAQDLAVIDFSSNSAVRQTLRRHLAERSVRYGNRSAGLNRYIRILDGRAMAGTLIVALLAFGWIFGLLAPQHASATPAYTTVFASADLSGKPVASHTKIGSHDQEFYPKPVPTPMTLSATNSQSATLTVSIPMRIHPSLGQQFPIITTTTSK